MSKEVPSCKEDILAILPYVLHNMQASNKEMGTSYDIFNNDDVRRAMIEGIGYYFLKHAPLTSEGSKLGFVKCAAILKNLEQIINTFDFKTYIIQQVKIEAIMNKKHNVTVH